MKSISEPQPKTRASERNSEDREQDGIEYKEEIEIETQKMKTALLRETGSVLQNRRVKKSFWFLTFFLGILIIFAVHFLPEDLPVREGEVSPTTIKASQTITIEDSVKTAERKKQAEENIKEIYILDRSILTRMEQSLDDSFTVLEGIINADSSSIEKIKALEEKFSLQESTVRALVSLDAEIIDSLQIEAQNLLRNNWQNGVRESEVTAKKTELYNQIDLLNMTVPYKNLLKSVFNQMNFQANYLIDEEATLKAKKEASQNEGVVMVELRKGQKIVGEGELVTAEHIEILEALGYKRSAAPYITLLGITIFTLLVYILTVIYLKLYRKDLYRKELNLLLLGLLCFVSLLVAHLISAINISSNPQIAKLVGYLIPVATCSMLIAILLDTTLAIFMTALLSFYIGILTDYQLPYAITAFVSGLVGVYSVIKFNQHFDWVKAGLFISIANVVSISAMGLMNNDEWFVLLIGCSIGVVNGIVSSIFAYGSLPFLESGFKVTTSVRLLELSNPNQPLLKRLLVEAPGTYHHSIMVGNLAEAAADAVGADSLLVRVGAFYHDIGKLKRPYFFTENQLGADNPHDKLSPSLSALIITSHLKDGLEIARQHNLPPEVIDLIAQHHGTGLVTYFYHKALEMGNSDSIKEEDYRYQASKPQSKEAAIIMLADSIEAAVRSMSTPNAGKIEAQVRKMIKERLEDGQLDECALTFKDLDLIATAFTRILSGVFHTRIEYPENVLEAMKGGNLFNGDLNGESAGENRDNSTNGRSDLQSREGD